MSRTVKQKTNIVGFPKAGEVIEITGTHDLEASDRAILNILYQTAHDSGKITEPDAEWEVPLSVLRFSAHESSDRVRDSLRRLMRIVVTVPYQDTKTGEDRVLITPIFDFFDVSAEEATARASLKFGLHKKMRPILARSNRWGRIKTEVICAMTSKYAQALYEIVQLRENMNKCIEVFSVDRFRDLMGVPPGKLLDTPNLLKRAIIPAVLEVDGLSDMGVRVEFKRKSPRAPVDGVIVSWWKKDEENFRNTYKERQRSKIGRMARLKETLEQATK
jgi:Initiator Replication protein